MVIGIFRYNRPTLEFWVLAPVKFNGWAQSVTANSLIPLPSGEQTIFPGLKLASRSVSSLSVSVMLRHFRSSSLAIPIVRHQTAAPKHSTGGHLPLLVTVGDACSQGVTPPVHANSTTVL
jgi:hypothetical protein